jgi:hypothetical protein
MEQVVIVDHEQQNFRLSQSVPPTPESRGAYRSPSIDFLVVRAIALEKNGKSAFEMGSNV